MMPGDNLDKAIAGLKNRKGSATEIMRQVVSMLETVATLDPSMKDRAGAALALLRGPKSPTSKPDDDY